MKNKITKLFLALLAITLSNNVNAQEKQEALSDVAKSTNSEFLINFAKEKTAEFEVQYKKAVEKAKEKGLPISGTNDRGQFFTVYKYDEVSDVIINRVTYNNVSGPSSIKTVKADYLHGLGITGAGMIAGIWDGGIPRPTHVGLSGRVTIKDNGNVGMESDGINHGTHVGGTIASNGATNIEDTKGIAPSAALWAYNWTNDEAEMAAAATQNLLVSNHSYGLNNYDLKAALGVGVFGRYTTTSKDIDNIHNNAPYYVSVWAAGNDRDHASQGQPQLNPGFGGRDILANEGTSKNNIVVAAINGISNYTSSSSAVMSSFSCWGPTDDFRVKPDISAKGVDVKSLWNLSNVATRVESGTSMAAPAVTGSIVLWQQYYFSLFNKYMRSSTVRALMAHTALEAGPQIGPDHMYGWGVFNVEGGAIVMSNVSLNKADLLEETLNNSEVKEYSFTTVGGAPLVATIAWNDPSGVALDSGTNISVPRLINDLDLRIINTDTNTEYLPYMLNRTWAQIAVNSTINTKGDNIADNIEKVEIIGAPAGNYKVEVSHKNSLAGGSQIFSLVITGKDGALSIEEEVLNKLKIYPNPVVDSFTIDGDIISLLNSEMSMYDMSGKLVKNNILKSSSDFTIDMNGLTSGVYIFNLSKNGASKSFKIVKK